MSSFRAIYVVGLRCRVCSRNINREPSSISRPKAMWIAPFADRRLSSTQISIGTFALLEAVRSLLVPASSGGSRELPFSSCFHGRGVRLARSARMLNSVSRRRTLRTVPMRRPRPLSDHLVRAYHHTYGLPVLTTNCSNNYGPYQFPEKLIPLMILNAQEGKPLPVYGDGKNVRDWLYVEDHCDAISNCACERKVGRDLQHRRVE